MFRIVAIASALTLFLIFADGRDSAAGPFSITKIADSNLVTGDITSFIRPSINDHGEVSFTTHATGYTYFGNGIDSGFGPEIRTLANSATYGAGTSINNFGQVSVRLQNPDASNSWAIVAIDAANSSQQLIARSGSGPATVPYYQNFFPTNVPYAPTINDAGYAAFRAGKSFGDQGIYVSDGTGETTIANRSGAFNNFKRNSGSALYGFSINESNNVAFYAQRDDATRGIYIGDGSENNLADYTTIADTQSGFFDLQDMASLNDHGRVVFNGITSAGTEGIFVGDGSETALSDYRSVASTANLFDDIGQYADINNSDEIAFSASVNSKWGIYFDSAEGIQNVLAVGDTIFGSEVVSLDLKNESLNENGQIVFRAVLADGTAGIYRADPNPSAPKLPLSNFVPTQGSLSGNIDSSNPTIVISHGWQPLSLLGGPDWMADMKLDIEAELGSEVNVVTWRWDNADTLDLGSATMAASFSGYDLARQLLDTGAQHIHFIGHSLGNHVNAYASKLLELNNVDVQQFTILDRPFGNSSSYGTIAGNAIGLVGANPVLGGLIGGVAGQALDSGEKLLFNQLLSDVEYVDNYSGSLFLGATGSSLGSGYNASVFRNHSGVRDEYRLSIGDFSDAPDIPNSGILGVDGFDWSINGCCENQRPAEMAWSPETIIETIIGDVVSFASWNSIGGSMGSSGPELMDLVENSPAYLWQDIELPAGADYLRFDFRWIDGGDGDHLSLHFGDALLFTFLGGVFSSPGFISSGLIPIWAFAGQTDQLLFSLNSLGDSNAHLQIANLMFVSAAIPEPPVLLIGAIFLFGIIWHRRRIVYSAG